MDYKVDLDLHVLHLYFPNQHVKFIGGDIFMVTTCMFSAASPPVLQLLLFVNKRVFQGYEFIRQPGGDIICTNQTSSVHSEWLVWMVNDGFRLTDTVLRANILWFLNAKCTELIKQ